MSPTLTDLMHRAADGHEPDTAALAHEARRRGLGIRRRRRVVGLVGAATATVVVLGGAQVVGGALPGPDPDQVSPRTTAAAPPDDIRADGRTTAAALLDVLRDVSAGDADDVEGGARGPLSSARLVWTPTSGSGPTTVEITVQTSAGFLGDCAALSARRATDCESERRADGYGFESLLQQTAERPGVDVVRRVVTVERPDGVRVEVSSSNGLDLEGTTADSDRSTMLSVAQLRTIADDPTFGPRMDSGWADPDRLPPDFREVPA